MNDISEIEDILLWSSTFVLESAEGAFLGLADFEFVLVLSNASMQVKYKKKH